MLLEGRSVSLYVLVPSSGATTFENTNVTTAMLTIAPSNTGFGTSGSSRESVNEPYVAPNTGRNQHQNYG